MNALAVRLLAVVLALAGSLALGYRWGSTASDNAHQADQNRAARVAQERFDAEQLRGQTAVASLTTERQAFAQTYTDLQEQFHELQQRRVPLVVLPAHRDPGACVSGGAPDRAAGVAKDGASGADARSDDRDLHLLSAGAVWMWNSALAGTDQPAGACGSADTSEAACAAETALTLDDAWRNHAINAQRCAEDRLNHQRLIDFINRQPTPETAP
jgi:hypothetical protein